MGEASEKAAYPPVVEEPLPDLRARLAEAEQPEYGDAWTRDKKGHLIRIEGFVWDCDDDYCGCSEAHVTAIFHNRVTGNSVIRIGLWDGGFHTDHEPGADRELAAFRRALRASDPEMEARITWQGGIDYDA